MISDVSTSTSKINEHVSPVAVSVFQNLSNKNLALSKELELRFSPRTIDLDFTIPPPPMQTPKINIIDMPISKNRHIKEPLGIIYNKEDANVEKSINLPTHGDVMEKLAVTMIRIRRRKMKIHKRRKFLKRTKALRLKIKNRKRSKGEKRFLGNIKFYFRKADEFDAKKYVQEKIAQCTREILPNRYRGEVLPEATIRQFLENDRQKLLAKLNKKRLTLDPK